LLADLTRVNKTGGFSRDRGKNHFLSHQNSCKHQTLTSVGDKPHLKSEVDDVRNDLKQRNVKSKCYCCCLAICEMETSHELI
jgi:hypothetical protein